MIKRIIYIQVGACNEKPEQGYNQSIIIHPPAKFAPCKFFSSSGMIPHFPHFCKKLKC